MEIHVLLLLTYCGRRLCWRLLPLLPAVWSEELTCLQQSLGDQVEVRSQHKLCHCMLPLTSQKIPLFAWECCESRPILSSTLQNIAKQGFFAGEAGFARLLCNLAELAHHASFILFHNCGSGIWPTMMLLWFPQWVCLKLGYHPNPLVYHHVSIFFL